MIQESFDFCSVDCKSPKADMFEPSWHEPDSFHEALDFHMRKHGETYWTLHRAITLPSEKVDPKTIANWQNGSKSPRGLSSMDILERIERRYSLPQGYFRGKLPHPGRAAIGYSIAGVTASERRRLAWHLPIDFEKRTSEEKQEILNWVKINIVSGATEYRRYQARAGKCHFAVQFPNLLDKDDVLGPEQYAMNLDAGDSQEEEIRGVVHAHPQLTEEMKNLLCFKTSTLTSLGFQRIGTWGNETASQKIEHLGLMFGALAASPQGVIKGYGVPLHALTFSLLVFPPVWDWYLQWRESRRGFYTRWEIDMLRVGLAITRKDTGWLRQNPKLALRLVPVGGLVSQEEINKAKTSWGDVCEDFHKYAFARVNKLINMLLGRKFYQIDCVHPNTQIDSQNHPYHLDFLSVGACAPKIVDTSGMAITKVLYDSEIKRNVTYWRDHDNF